jgi:hypothetical protein
MTGLDTCIACCLRCYQAKPTGTKLGIKPVEMDDLRGMHVLGSEAMLVSGSRRKGKDMSRSRPAQPVQPEPGVRNAMTHEREWTYGTGLGIQYMNWTSNEDRVEEALYTEYLVGAQDRRTHANATKAGEELRKGNAEEFSHIAGNVSPGSSTYSTDAHSVSPPSRAEEDIPMYNLPSSANREQRDALRSPPRLTSELRYEQDLYTSAPRTPQEWF